MMAQDQFSDFSGFNNFNENDDDDDDMVLQSVEEGAELNTTAPKLRKSTKNPKSDRKKSKKKKKKSSSSKKKSRSDPLTAEGSNSTSITSTMSSEGASGWPENQQAAWNSRQESAKWQGGLASVGDMSRWTEEQASPRTRVVVAVTGNGQSIAEESLDPQIIFQNIDPCERKQRSSASLNASKSSGGSGSALRGNVGSMSGKMQRSNLKQAPPSSLSATTSEENFMVEIPAEKWETFDDNLQSTATKPLPLPPFQASTFTEFPTDKWEEMSDMDCSDRLNNDDSLFDAEATIHQPTAAAHAPTNKNINGPEIMGNTLVNYLLSMGYQKDKAEQVAASFVTAQKEQGVLPIPSAAMSASMPPSSAQPQSASNVAVASKLREMEQNSVSRSHQRQVVVPPAVQPHRRPTTSNTNNTNSAGRQPTTRPRSSQQRSRRQLASATPSGSESAPLAHSNTRRSSRRTNRTAAPMYERFARPGAVEMEGRAFGAPHRQAPVSPSAQDEDTSDDFVVQAAVVSDGDLLGRQGGVVTAVASPLSLKSALSEKPIRRVIICGFIVIAGIVAGIVSFFVFRDSGSGGSSDGGGLGAANGPTMAPSSAPTIISIEVQEAAASISGWDALSNSLSPQLQAVGWLSTFDKPNDDNYGPSFLQRYVLVVFYYSTNGEDWLDRESWLNPSLHECDWSEGILCNNDSTNRRIVRGLDARRNGLAGTLPDEVSMLGAIEYILLSKNNIGGSIPSGIGKLNRLASLNLATNQLTGSLPTNIGGARDLVLLDLHQNGINGTLPESFYELAFLRTLDLSSNQISGSITEEVGNFQVLSTLNVRRNKLSGTLTPGFGDIKTLDYMWLDYNELTGSVIPLSKNSGNRIEITMSHNKLTGSIPIGEMRRDLQDSNSQSVFRVQRVDVAHNQLTGTINPIAGFLPTLRYFDFSGNRFTGEFPGYASWPRIEYVAGANNMFTGTLAVGYPQTLEHFEFAGNNFTGGVPETLCDYPNLNFLDVSDNEQLNGTIPACLADASKLRHLDLANSNLHGTVAPNFGTLIELEVFNVSHNTLSSTIPSELALCVDLKILDLSHNDFMGNIPSQIGDLRFLKNLHLAENDLTGTLPSDVGELTKLEELSLVGNALLRGIIPLGLCESQVELTASNVGCNFECNCCNMTRC